jgi:hypothetical protein
MGNKMKEKRKRRREKKNVRQQDEAHIGIL